MKPRFQNRYEAEDNHSNSKGIFETGDHVLDCPLWSLCLEGERANVLTSYIPYVVMMFHNAGINLSQYSKNTWIKFWLKNRQTFLQILPLIVIFIPVNSVLQHIYLFENLGVSRRTQVYFEDNDHTQVLLQGTTFRKLCQLVVTFLVMDIAL